MSTNSVPAWPSPTTAPRRQRVAVGALVFLCIFCLSNLSRNSDGTTSSFRRSLQSNVESEAVEVSYELSSSSSSSPDAAVAEVFPSFLVPPEPSDVPKQRVFTSIGGDHPESLDLLSHGCSITSQVRVVAAGPKWILQSIDEFGNEKTVGGDEFYVTYTDNNKNSWGIFKSDKPTAVAVVTDLHNGRYELDFVTTPVEPNPERLSGTGFLRVWFQYSCGIGFMAQPTKSDWHSNGSSSFYHKLNNIMQPPIRNFVPPHLDHICFHDFDKIYGVGDSVLSLFVINKKATLPNMVLHTLFGALGSETLRSKIQFIEQEVGKDLRNDQTALLVGSSTWDILMDTFQNDPYFEDHLASVRRYVTELKMRHPGTTILWKSPNTLHVHRSVCTKEAGEKCLERIKYMSASRSRYLYEEQKKIMEELDVPFLDLYEAYYLSAEWTYENDGRHYHRQLTSRMLKWFNDCDAAYADDSGSDYAAIEG